MISDPRVVVTAKFTIKPSKREAFELAWKEFADLVRKLEPKCLVWNVAVSEDGLTYWMYEEYMSQMALEEHEHTPHSKKFSSIAQEGEFFASVGRSSSGETPEINKGSRPYF
ncbi:hypothetical protein DACRYDRAFT_110346 [Dacryopinax primogenitus]|uniref:ABM domain-containing protein n=1 Tax=Dacryopinax primogenitus (strain DJM 731) TaxID=1858805 RepID=M5FU49_DACPD|nr:uncharacterized protein DACRYDRAFT_110346 [Dacryopinax primogenitus]EJT99019.1 hypothetical protein DACRYDRAFT_110346 [Dacryopinax primogenitus]